MFSAMTVLQCQTAAAAR